MKHFAQLQQRFNLRFTFIAMPALLFAILALCIKAGITIGFENWAYTESVEHMSPLLTSIMKTITHIGDPTSVIVICLVLFLIPQTRKIYAVPVSLCNRFICPESVPKKYFRKRTP